MRLPPRAGFDWERVNWSAPDALASDECSYCGLALYSDDTPLPWRRDDGWRAFFCASCQDVWFGIPEPAPTTVSRL